jgi:hypothetical protein
MVRAYWGVRARREAGPGDYRGQEGNGALHTPRVNRGAGDLSESSVYIPVSNPYAEGPFSVRERAFGLGSGGGMNPRPLGYEPYDVRLARLGQSPVAALASANLRVRSSRVLPPGDRKPLVMCGHGLDGEAPLRRS